MKIIRSYTPSESMGGTRGELVPAREVRCDGAERNRLHFPQKMCAPWEVFGL